MHLNEVGYDKVGAGGDKHFGQIRRVSRLTVAPRAAVNEDVYRVIGKYRCAVANNGDLFIQPVYPNPVSDNITIEVSSTRNRDVDLWIYNDLGQTIKSETFDFYPPVKTYTVDVSDFPKGIYFMVVSQRQEIYVIKFVK